MEKLRVGPEERVLFDQELGERVRTVGARASLRQECVWCVQGQTSPVGVKNLWGGMR